MKVKLEGKQIHTGDKIRKGSYVNLILGDGRGESDADLPYLIGLSLDEAIMALRGMTLKPGSITYENVTDTTKAVVVRQFPAQSESVKQVGIGSSVDLVLSDPVTLR